MWAVCGTTIRTTSGFLLYSDSAATDRYPVFLFIAVKDSIERKVQKI